ncbi:chitinase [Streptacidiphilus pinicola]|uniref:Chitinase n=1 Tax=Streptacidiphilus pinicola TaxID=2219663 RepID=A0A2X0ISS8_9ACTN|nr:chitinase [Streptacidiphilus pinicola]
MAAPTAGASTTHQATTRAATTHPATTVPAHVFAPYVETYTGDDFATVAAKSGVKWVSLAFLQTDKAGSCSLYWDGSTSQPVSSSVYGTSFAKLRAAGGDAIPSLGGYTADTSNTELADSCTSVSTIATQLEKLISTYDLARVDFDVEQNSLTNTAGIDRRNKAIAKVESWAASTGRHVQFSYTLPTNTDGLDSGGTGVLKNAVANHARIDVVNIMTFDYYTGGSHEMATATETAAQGLVNLLAQLYPTKSSTQRWAMVGVTEMPGIDDYGKPETFTTADAKTVYSWALGKGVNEVSMWASERDNGGCPGTGGSDSCSGISQSTWYFSHAWEPYTH